MHVWNTMRIVAQKRKPWVTRVHGIQGQAQMKAACDGMYMKRFTQWLPLVILIPLWGGGLILDRVAERALIEDVHERLVVALHAHQQHLLAMLAHQQRGLRLFAAGAVGSLAKGNAP